MATPNQDCALADVRALVSDVDGVLTDGRIYLGAAGEELRSFHMRDGLGIRMLQDAGVTVGWLSAGQDTGLVRRRAAMLDVEHVDVGHGDKGLRFLAMCKQMDVAPETVVYVGDDLNDLPAMAHAGGAACPADAAMQVRETVGLVLDTPGGHGAVRELAERILIAKGVL